MYRCFAFASALIIYVAFGLCEARAEIVLFSDNFDSGASPLWGNEVGSWFAASGIYDSQVPNNNPPTYTGLPFILGDFSLDVDVNALQDGGIWLRSADNQNGVLLVTGGNIGTGTGLYWHVVTNGIASGKLNEVAGLFTPGVSNVHLRVEVSGDTYSAFVNGALTPATTLTTSAYANGRVGLYDFSGQTFDNVAITVPEPSSWVVFGLGSCAILGVGWARRRHCSC